MRHQLVHGDRGGREPLLNWIQGVGDPALEAPHRLHVRFALGALAPVVDRTVGVQPQLGDRGDVDDVVDPAVTGS
jgi:hypothetical protein